MVEIHAEYFGEHLLPIEVHMLCTHYLGGRKNFFCSAAPPGMEEYPFVSACSRFEPECTCIHPGKVCSGCSVLAGLKSKNL